MFATKSPAPDHVAAMQELRDALFEERRKNAELQGDISALEAQLEGDIPAATRWLQLKVIRQRGALDRLHSRVVTQRFQLRTLEELGRGLSREEYLAARAAEENPAVRERIAEPAA